MRALSEVRKEQLVGFSSCCLAAQLPRHMESMRLLVALFWVCSKMHTECLCSSQNVPDRLRYTRAVLESKDMWMWFCLSLWVWVPYLSPTPGETALEKILTIVVCPSAGKRSSQNAGKRSLPCGRRVSQLVCVCKRQLDVQEFEQALGVGDRQGSLACCSPWGHTESDRIERLKWPEHRKNMEVQRGEVTCLRSESWEWEASRCQAICLRS